MCQPAPVINQFGRDVERVFGIPTTYNQPGPGGVFLGSVGDQAHSTRASSHNCASAPGGQESPVNGVAYHPGYAHAWDGRPRTKAIGEAMRAATLKDRRCRYVLFDNVGTKPNGETWTLDHPTWHVSMNPGTHDDTRPFFDEGDLFTMGQFEQIMDRLPGEKQQARDRNRVKAIGQLARANNRMLEELTDAQANERKVDLKTLSAARAARDAALLILDELDQEEDE